MAGIHLDGIAQVFGGPPLAAVASGLMLLEENASRLVRLHRLAAVGMSLPNSGDSEVSPSAVRSILKHKDIGGPGFLVQEDPYSELLVQSVTFAGGPYLVSGGTGEHAIADLEGFIEAAFQEPWMQDDLRVPARQLIKGLLTISDIVLRRAGLLRGTSPGGSARTAMEVPGANRLRELTSATFVSNEVLDAHGKWLRMVVDSFALDPGELTEPCRDDYIDDRLYVTPFLRLKDGYRVVLPLDLAITIRFHLLRFVKQAGQLEQLGRGWRDAAFRRFARSLPADRPLVELEHTDSFSRYLRKIDERRDLHVIVATDPLTDWDGDVWGMYDTRYLLQNLTELMSPSARANYSSAEELLHLVITDSPGRSAFWGVPNVEDADPMLIARSDDLEVMLHHESDDALGLLLFAQAIDNRAGQSMSTSILDVYSSYVDRRRSFYLSDDRPPDFTVFQTGDGLNARLKFGSETDRHGVVVPRPGAPIVQFQRRYERDAPEISISLPNRAFIGCVVEFEGVSIFVSLKLADSGFVGIETELLDCVSFWLRECLVLGGVRTKDSSTELVLRINDSGIWRTLDHSNTSGPIASIGATDTGYVLDFTTTFVAQLQKPMNDAERQLVAVLLAEVFETSQQDLGQTLDLVAPFGPKRMLNLFSQEASPDMVAERLPVALTGHDQVDAQLLDQLGEWLRSPTGGGFSTGSLAGTERVGALNAAVSYLFELMAEAIDLYDQRFLIDFLVAQNESVIHSARTSTRLLRSRLACFGEQSHTVTDLVEDRREVSAAHRANRFLIEYVAAQPPTGTRIITTLDYYRVLNIAREIIERATASDFLYYDLADLQVSILRSGRLGVSREQPVMRAMEIYATNAGRRSVRDALSRAEAEPDSFDGVGFIARSEEPMRAEFGFTLSELREVCGGLLDLGVADQVTRMKRSSAIASIASSRNMSEEAVATVVSGMTLEQRPNFLSIGSDAWPWRFNRDRSHIRRPLVLQGDELVFGFRSIYRLGVYWADSLLSGRLQGQAKTHEMQEFISLARGGVNAEFAQSVATKLQLLGLSTRTSVKKIAKHRIVDSDGRDLGDVDILAVHPGTRTIVAVEAKDFEVARTPAEISNELEKLFLGRKGKKSTVELHSKRIEWLERHLNEVVASFTTGEVTGMWQVAGLIVTSEPLISPLVQSSTIPVIPFGDVSLEALGLQPRRLAVSGRKKSNSRQRKKK